ncbi:L-serine ammonia-lyase, iron-sulfur-dependent subunit beta [Alkalihalobacillus pseudalcaliphilus]|uniref:L-serine ammonia-lyase, iron-sulfur-dependent subunit beta n=1 Tax=Alkalihalobacillus pseudalcaliphilus TaxID=79884 RepID=UPI00064DF97C|nr:L-serine ammonia-lyase, iron-sulfur-dependent subunit beta [Alkalihalobacillus pseudalcaliphilus]KMK77169.1 serine dehydratase [Alkalihalobacillus pseudalcaliphilus]
MKYRTVFDIIGPVMVGPSSSHTAGAARIGKVARTLFGKEPVKASFHLFGSFEKTYKGHGTDVALVAGILDFETDDPRLPKAIDLAKAKGMEIHFIEEEAKMEHPNTVKVVLEHGGERIELVGISIGGGKIEIIELNGFELKLSGNHPAILVVHNDRAGVIAAVANVLAAKSMNIGHMEVSRKEKGQEALMVIEVDQNVDTDVLHELNKLPHIEHVTKIHE